MAAAAPADAVTNQALGWRRVLAAHGIDGDVYAEHVHPDLAGTVRRLDSFPDGGRGPTLLRYSIWSAAVDAALTVARERLGLLYHNITPGHLLAGARPGSRPCVTGAAMPCRSSPACDTAIARFRLQRPRARRRRFPAGPPWCRCSWTFPPVPARPTADPDPVVLTVGRIAPASASRRPSARWRCCAQNCPRAPGRHRQLGRLRRLRAALGDFTTRLGVVDAVRFRGRVSDAERDAAYAAAGVYVCTSAHEGFCAPLVEAMARGLPVVAHDAGAVAETLGGAGLVVPKADAAVTAAALETVLTRADVRATMAHRAGERLRALAPAVVEPQILAAVRPLLA